MLIFVRFSPDAGVDPLTIEEAVQGAVGRSGSVIGASSTAIDVELRDESERLACMQRLAAALRELGLPATTELDVPSAGQRFGILDF